jgi:hypothetical protein
LIVTSSIGLILWGVSNLPFAIDQTLYLHSGIEKFSYFVGGAGPIVIAIAVLISSRDLTAKFGSASTVLGIIGLFVVGVSTLPLAIADNTNFYRIYEFGQTVGYVLLGVSLLMAMPMITSTRGQTS